MSLLHTIHIRLLLNKKSLYNISKYYSMVLLKILLFLCESLRVQDCFAYTLFYAILVNNSSEKF